MLKQRSEVKPCVKKTFFKWDKFDWLSNCYWQDNRLYEICDETDGDSNFSLIHRESYCLIPGIVWYLVSYKS